MAPAAPHRRIALLALSLAALAFGCGPDTVIKTQPEIFLPLAAFDLGEVPVLNQKQQSVEIRNLGRAALTLEQLSLEEGGSPFSIASAPAGIGAGESAWAVVAFVPPREEVYAATLVIQSDDLNQPTVEVALAGRGSTAARVEADASLAFTRVCEGGDALKRLSVRSTGTADLILEEVRFGDGTAAEFAFVSSTRTPATVPAGGEILLTVRYSPTAASPDESTGSVHLVTTDPDRRELDIPLTATVNRAPRAQIGDVANPSPGATVALDGSASADPDGDLPLGWLWSIKSSPIGSRSKPTPNNTATSSLALDLPGSYTVSLVAKDSQGCASAPAFKEIWAKPAQQLLVELVWDNPDTDLDLHMAPRDQPFYGPLDCYFAAGQMSPDWGLAGDASDDPSLDRDALTGYGPEIVGYATPASGSYQVMVAFYSDHQSKTPATTATLRVYEFGAVKAELKQRLLSEGQRWTALSLDWPSGSITPLNTVEGP